MENRKEKLFKSFIQLSSGKSFEDIIPLMLAFSEKAKSEGITFSQEETLEIINEIKKNASPEEKAKIDVIVSMFNFADIK